MTDNSSKTPFGPKADALLSWYDAHRRDLPWRAAPGQPADPYRVWLSEIMLQQTTVKTVGPYFHSFLECWPTLDDLAAAPLDAVLEAWAGLGYYSRARNLAACAKVVASEHGGRFPQTAAGLRALPGIGAYTSAAIAAIAFNEAVAVVDGNVERVTARVFAIDEPFPLAKKQIPALVAPLVPADRPGDFAQAMMDLGATVCTPKNPSCTICPWEDGCLANRQGLTDTLPAKVRKKAKPIRRGVVYWVTDGQGRVLVRRRPEKGLLGGMLEFPSSDWQEAPPERAFAASSVRASAPFSARWEQLPGLARHTFTHFHLELKIVTAEVPKAKRLAGRFLHPDDFVGKAIPTQMKKVAKIATPAPGPLFEKRPGERRSEEGPPATKAPRAAAR
ncbi:MAG: A/G-specific adenine glycosylase [Pseudomonadota bacterium]